MVKSSIRHVLLSALMLTFFLSYQAGTTLFTHTHIVEGRIITHSHPYDSDAHAHSDAQIFAIYHLSAFWGEEAAVADLLSWTYLAIEQIIGQVSPELHSQEWCMGGGLRAPPVCC